MNKKQLTKNVIEELMKTGLSGYNQVVYNFINLKDYESAYSYVDKKMDFIIDELLDMSDEDLTLFAYCCAMVESYAKARAALKVLFEDADTMKDEEHLDLFGLIADALCHLKSKHNKKAKALLNMAVKLEPNDFHFGADECLIEQAKELLKKLY